MKQYTVDVPPLTHAKLIWLGSRKLLVHDGVGLHAPAHRLRCEPWNDSWPRLVVAGFQEILLASAAAVDVVLDNLFDERISSMERRRG
jgi:hypothetical protein